MQKKVLALAVAGAFGAPAVAMAQTSTVQVYGTIYMEYAYVDQGVGPVAPAVPQAGRNNVDILQAPGSEIGFKGEEKLGGGLSAWFQCSSTADIRGQDSQGFCSRNSAVGLRSGFGNVFVGRWDTPYKRTSGPTLVGANQTGVWGSSFLTHGGSTSTADNSARAAFMRRQNNLISYDSPDFGGFRVMAAYSSTNGATGSTTGVTNSKSRVMSLGVQYSAGPLYISGGYERHNEFGAGRVAAPAGAAAASTNPNAIPTAAVTGGDVDDDGWHLGAAYTWGPVRFGGHYTRQRLEQSTITQSKISAFHLGVDWRIVGPHGLRGAWSSVRDVSGNSVGAIGTGIAGSGSTRPFAINGGLTGQTGADQWQIAYVYTFSKRTKLDVGYVRLDNDARAFYSLGGVVSPRPGENQDAFAMSVRHTF